MAKLGQAQEQTMDEILASIRRIIQDEDVRKSGLPAAASRAGATPPPPPVASVSRLFAEEVPVQQSGETFDADAEAETNGGGNVVELAIAQAMEEARAEVASDALDADAAAEPEEAMPQPSAPAPQRPRAIEERAFPPRSAPAGERRPSQQSLLSPRADAAVSTAFNQLAANMLSGSARTIDELVEDMLRPMLRTWLDTNLPPMVERLVREEIERVSRGRR